MFRIASGVVLAALLVSPPPCKPPALPDTSSGYYILKGCEMLAAGDVDHSWAHMGEDTTRQLWTCGGAVKATMQLMEIHHEYCPPEGFKNGEAFQVVGKYMQDHPEKLHQGFGFVIFEALQKQWPCPKPDK